MVKAIDQKSIGVIPRRFESCQCRSYLLHDQITRLPNICGSISPNNFVTIPSASSDKCKRDLCLLTNNKPYLDLSTPLPHHHHHPPNTHTYIHRDYQNIHYYFTLTQFTYFRYMVLVTTSFSMDQTRAC